MSTPEPPLSLGDHPPLLTGGAARTRTVTIAAALLVVQAILGLVGLAVSSAFRDILGEEKMSANAIAKQLSEGPTNISLFGVGCSVLLSVIFLVLAAFVLRGSNPTRISAWVLSGLGLLCFGVGGLYSTPSAAKQSGPRWYLEYSAAVSVLTLAIYAAIIVLLALRPSNEYFAKRPA